MNLIDEGYAFLVRKRAVPPFRAKFKIMVWYQAHCRNSVLVILLTDTEGQNRKRQRGLSLTESVATGTDNCELVANYV